MQLETDHSEAEVIQLPSPTAWPMVLALGLSLMLTGLVTHVVIGHPRPYPHDRRCVGWFLQVLPHENHIEGSSSSTPRRSLSSAREPLIERLPSDEMHRKILPRHHLPDLHGHQGRHRRRPGHDCPRRHLQRPSLPQLLVRREPPCRRRLYLLGRCKQRISGPVPSPGHHRRRPHPRRSPRLLVGLLYGAMLPMFPRYPILTAGLVVASSLHRDPLLCPRHRQPHPQPADRLVLLRSLADRLRPRLRLRRQPSRAGPHPAVPRLCPFAVRAGLHTDMGSPNPDSEKEDGSR